MCNLNAKTASLRSEIRAHMPFFPFPDDDALNELASAPKADQRRWMAELAAGRAAPPHATQRTRPAVARLPAGTRVLVQRLVAKPEYNGKRARVLSFDEHSGRYVVALDDGKEMSLKVDCVARAGCAAAGCASEEANSQCSRCKAVRYCSRDCQQADWKAHKPSCAVASGP
jgi:hypothetical protein